MFCLINMNLNFGLHTDSYLETLWVLHLNHEDSDQTGQSTTDAQADPSLCWVHIILLDLLCFQFLMIFQIV